jgi:hypothetical protein
MRFIKAILVLVIYSLSGYAIAQLAADSSSQILTPPPADKAQIIFLNASNAISGNYFTGIYDVKENEKELLGMLQMGSKTKLLQNVEPGKHIFMSNMTSHSHFLEADVEAGKRYYVLVRFLFANGHQLRPIRNSGNSDFSVNNPKFEEWKSSTKLIVKTQGADEWYANHQKDVDDAQAKGWKEWLRKNPEQKAELTLNKEDQVEN